MKRKSSCFGVKKSSNYFEQRLLKSKPLETFEICEESYDITGFWKHAGIFFTF